MNLGSKVIIAAKENRVSEMVQFTSETPFSLSYKYNQQFVVYFDQLYGASHRTTHRIVLAKLAKDIVLDTIKLDTCADDT